jgi:hypothetical protein
MAAPMLRLDERETKAKSSRSHFLALSIKKSLITRLTGAAKIARRG